ncbi:MAG: hypothetical protein M3460_19735 [Actinomycetota bacterium]|nr:hypothetical protein [Actinomycetota bacterium]
MEGSSETHETQDLGAGVAGTSGVAYDPERVGEPGQPGVPTGDQYPSNEGEAGMDDSIVADVDIPGPYPSERGDPTGEPLSPGPEPTKADRGAGSLGDLTEDRSTATIREETTGGLGSPIYDEEKRQDK